MSAISQAGEPRLDETPSAPVPPSGSTRRWAAAAPWISFVGRLVLAAVFGLAAFTKITDPAGMVRAVRAYRLLPEGFVHPVAYALPSFELVLALLLLIGLATRLVGAIAAATMLVFIGGITSAGARGLHIDCGCFGGGGTVTQTHYLLEIGRDSLLLLVLVFVVLASRSRWSVDEYLDRGPARKAGGASGAALASTPDHGARLNARRASAVARSARAAKTAEIRQAAARQQLRQRRSLAGGSAIVALALASLLGIAVNASATSSSGTAAAATAPTGATAAGGILVGSPSAPIHLVAYEDPQCPACAEFEKLNGSVVSQAFAAGKVQIEYRVRSFLGVESVRAANALAAAQDEGKFEQLREAMFSHQPKEGTGGYTTDILLALGRTVGLDSTAFGDKVRSMTYAKWVAHVDDQASKDGNVATPELIVVGGKPLTQAQMFDPQQFRAAVGMS